MKPWIRIRITAYADPKHWFKCKIDGMYCVDGEGGRDLPDLLENGADGPGALPAPGEGDDAVAAHVVTPTLHKSIVPPHNHGHYIWAICTYFESFLALLKFKKSVPTVSS